ncbi:hypothetical protein FPSE_10863 [Fusarium pseudograminearum CS3096]|uniref:Ubiquitin-like domain-containing protein n=1 Tax=Fusarium pseudograminearum (strain CS3096) TaxID=1028729 RepID=K3VA20_FUSPC|nr:hypothetical protein FPSE_10863 [Fusarium pseudograminearum CS3096]EKJ68938.1 hypothetical protein FPSE_10863 [Fusarium pseudograminearum CS3096]
MSEHLTRWSPVTKVTKKVKIDDLEISFKRTIRVPDNYDTNYLPPDAGSFPLYKVDDYAETLPLRMAQKGGLFIPMYQREAMWINFKSKCFYAIKVFVGGINAVSGEPSVEDAGTSLRRRNLIHQGKSVQDYIVTPDQRWLDGVAVEPGKIRQFVAMPVGTGHSIEAQMTGAEKAGGVQFEITRLDSKPPEGDIITIDIVTGGGKVHRVTTSRQETVEQLMRRIELVEKLTLDEMRLIYAGKHLEVFRTLADYQIEDNSRVQLLKRLRGGGGPGPTELEMYIAAGGLIKQGIEGLRQNDWKKSVPVTFNVQVLNSAGFEQVTGKKPPRSPITAKSYADCGYPFYSIYEEPTTISGAFDGLRSVAQIDQTSEDSLPADMPVMDVDTRQVRPRVNIGAVGILNPQGSGQELEFEWEMKERLNRMRNLF